MLELARIRPLEAAPGVTLAAPKTDLEPLLRAELRYELARDRWSFGVGTFVDLSLRKTSYELSAAAEREVLAQPARFRPGLRLGIAVR